jgi:hypothetical protein
MTVILGASELRTKSNLSNRLEFSAWIVVNRLEFSLKAFSTALRPRKFVETDICNNTDGRRMAKEGANDDQIAEWQKRANWLNFLYFV